MREFKYKEVYPRDIFLFLGKYRQIIMIDLSR